jgi:hypothetical protein
MPYGKRLGFVAIVTIMFGVLASVSPAVACDTIADNEFWSDNCLTDWNHYRVSDLTSGVQTIMHYDGHPGYTSSVDGVYGTSGGGGATPAAVRSFQTWAGLDDDGMTGLYTWGALDNAFSFSGNTTTNYKYYHIGSNQERMAVNKSNHQAYIRKPNNYWVRVDAWRSTGTTTWPN